MLNNARTRVQQLQDEFQGKVNLRKPLKEDFEKFMEVLKTKITDSQQINQFKQEQLDKLKELLLDDLNKEFDSVDKEKVTQLEQSFFNNVNDIIKTKAF